MEPATNCTAADFKASLAVFITSTAVAEKIGAQMLPKNANTPPFCHMSEVEPKPDTYNEALSSSYRNVWEDVRARELDGLTASKNSSPAVTSLTSRL